MALNINDQSGIGVRLTIPNNNGNYQGQIPNNSGNYQADVPNVTTVFANEKQRIANENQRIANEESRQQTGTALSNLVSEVQTKLDNGDFKGDKRR